MPKKTVTLTYEFELGEYFEDCGLDDGESDELNEYADGLRPRAVQILNEEFAKQKLPVSFEVVDMGSSHNNIRIAMFDPKNKFEDLDIDADEDGLTGFPVFNEEDEEKEFERAAKAWKTAYRRFEKEAKRR